MGSLSSNQRRVKSQILDNVYIQGSKGISVTLFDMPFDPVIERAEDQESMLLSKTKNSQVRSRVIPDINTNRATQQTKLNSIAENREKITTTPDETEEWAKVIEIVLWAGISV